MWQRILIYLLSVFTALTVCGQARHTVVADSTTHLPLANASIFDCRGKFIGISKTNGEIACASPTDYPLTVRYIGFYEKNVAKVNIDTIYLSENIAELPEIIVEDKKKRMLHILAYVREYSTLSSYTDTVTMFREKMVDFMLPTERKTKFKGWEFPRVLNSRSYYRYTDIYGLDSVSDRCSHHFTWSDWISMFPTIQNPQRLHNTDAAADTVYGRYGPAETWLKEGDKVSLNINILADTTSRRWVPNLSSFFKNEGTEFEQFRIRINYGNIIGNEVAPIDLSSYSFNIESRGRGHGMFMFNRHNEPFFVTTYTEVYILDKEFISVKEAKEWDKRKFAQEEIEIFESPEAPPLQASTIALIDRVNNIDADNVRLSLEPDQRLVSRRVNQNVGQRALSMLKKLTGITYYKSHKNFNNKWKKFTNKQTQKNNKK